MEPFSGPEIVYLLPYREGPIVRIEELIRMAVTLAVPFARLRQVSPVHVDFFRGSQMSESERQLLSWGRKWQGIVSLLVKKYPKTLSRVSSNAMKCADVVVLHCDNVRIVLFTILKRGSLDQKMSSNASQKAKGKTRRDHEDWQINTLIGHQMKPLFSKAASCNASPLLSDTQFIFSVIWRHTEMIWW